MTHTYIGVSHILKLLTSLTESLESDDIFYSQGDFSIFQVYDLRVSWIRVHEVVSQNGCDARFIYPQDDEQMLQRILAVVPSLKVLFTDSRQPVTYFLTRKKVYLMGIGVEPFVVELPGIEIWKYYHHYFLSVWYLNRPQECMVELEKVFGIPKPIRILEAIDTRCVPVDTMGDYLKYWSVPATTAQVLASLMRTCGAKDILEIGTGAGYSTIYLAKAVQITGGKVVTIERNPQKAELFRNTLYTANMLNIHLQEGDARDILPTLKGDFDGIFLDADRKHYGEYLNILIPRLRVGGFIIADNAFDHASDMIPLLEKLALYPQLRTHTLHVDNGLLISQRVSM